MKENTTDDGSARAGRSYLRVIDANLNRSREGIRVIEDTARFVLDRAEIYTRARELRHRLDLLTRGIYPELLKERDSAADAGRVIKEGPRENLAAILSANFRRAEESVRVLEEYSKLISPEAAPELKSIRFTLYLLEKDLLVKI